VHPRPGAQALKVEKLPRKNGEYSWNISAPVAIKMFIASQWLGAHPKFIDGISFSHQDLYVHQFLFLFLEALPTLVGK
jgi:hypothetical protein